MCVHVGWLDNPTNMHTQHSFHVGALGSLHVGALWSLPSLATEQDSATVHLLMVLYPRPLHIQSVALVHQHEAVCCFRRSLARAERDDVRSHSRLAPQATESADDTRASGENKTRERNDRISQGTRDHV